MQRCVSVAVAWGGDPLEYVKGLTLFEALPSNIRDQVMLFLGNDLSYSEVLRAAKRNSGHNNNNSPNSGRPGQSQGM